MCSMTTYGYVRIFILRQKIKRVVKCRQYYRIFKMKNKALIKKKNQCYYEKAKSLNKLNSF